MVDPAPPGILTRFSPSLGGVPFDPPLAVAGDSVSSRRLQSCDRAYRCRQSRRCGNLEGWLALTRYADCRLIPGLAIGGGQARPTNLTALTNSRGPRLCNPTARSSWSERVRTTTRAEASLTGVSSSRGSIQMELWIRNPERWNRIVGRYGRGRHLSARRRCCDPGRRKDCRQRDPGRGPCLGSGTR